MLTPVIFEVRAIRLSSSCLTIGTTYQPQSSTDFTQWTNLGSPFKATEAVWTTYVEAASPTIRYFRLLASDTP